MDYRISAAFGIGGSIASYLFGGWDATVQALLIFMAADYASGLVVAGVFRRSQKTESGGLGSKACFQGLVKKCMILLFVLLSTRLDAVLDTSYIRDGVCVAFMANELISIIENAGMMGVPVPNVVKNAIDLLKQREDNND